MSFSLLGKRFPEKAAGLVNKYFKPRWKVTTAVSNYYTKRQDLIELTRAYLGIYFMTLTMYMGWYS